MVVPGYLKRFTVAYYLQGLVPHAMPRDSPLSLIQELFRETPGLTESLIWLGDHRRSVPLAGRPGGRQSANMCSSNRPQDPWTLGPLDRDPRTFLGSNSV